MHITSPRRIRSFALCGGLLFAACGGGGGTGGGGGGGGTSTDASLAALALSAGALAPAFNPATTAYTAAAGLLSGSATVTPTSTDLGATIQVNGVAVPSGSASGPLTLAANPTPTPVTILVTAADHVTQRTYTVVFTRAAVLSQEAYVKASTTDADDQFGLSVAVSGDTLVVGSADEDSSATGIGGNQSDNTAAFAGAAYVFVRTGATWMQQAYLKASNTDAGDGFGIAVAISGDTILVGANGEDSSATGVGGNQADNTAANAGAAYVFVRSGTIWTQQAYLKASNAGAGDNFGFAVTLSGDTLAVGAQVEDGSANSMIDSGAAYAFVRNGTNWIQQAYLRASNANAGDRFGWAVALSGDTLVCGAPFGETAYVFVRAGTVWSPQTALQASNVGPGDLFGKSVAISGDTILVGATGEDSNATGVGGNQADNSLADAGAAYVFVRSGATWTQQAYLKASNPAPNDLFGGGVALSGDTLVVGALGEDSNATGIGGNQADNSASVSGAAYVWTRSGTAWTQLAYLKASNTGANDQFGLSVALSGDTLVVGAVGEDSGATGVNGNQADNSVLQAGAVYIVR